MLYLTLLNKLFPKRGIVLKKVTFYFLLSNIFLFMSCNIMAGGTDTATTSSSSGSSISDNSSMLSTFSSASMSTSSSSSMLSVSSSSSASTAKTEELDTKEAQSSSSSSDEAMRTYPVGTFSLELADPERKEIHAKDNQSIQRKIIIQVWYPAEEDKNSATPVARYKPLEDTIGKWFKKDDFYNILANKLWRSSLNLKPTMSRSKKRKRLVSYVMSKFKTSAKEGLPVFNLDSYPVIIFSHGNGMHRDSNIINCEFLANNGYVVVAIEHVCATKFTQFNDGTTVEHATGGIPNEELLNEVYGDVGFVLDQLAKNEKILRLFFNRLDLKNVGMFGHSLGGILAIKALKQEDRIQASVALDSPIRTLDETEDVKKPLMFLKATSHKKDCKDVRSSAHLNILKQNLGKNGYFYVGKNSGHNSFGDLPIIINILTPIILQSNKKMNTDNISKVCALGTQNETERENFVLAINEALLSFFEMTIKKIPNRKLNINGSLFSRF